MRKWIIGICFVALVAVCASVTSCEKYALPKLACDTDTIRAPQAGGEYQVTITSNVKWSFSFETIPDWVYIDVQFGQSNYAETDYPINIRVKENEAAEDRTAVMGYTSATLSHKLVIEQQGTGTDL
ncbi:MAG: BACON domain-containing protein [Bacteroidales bacterium]|nr:BACON domain-containing protein [Bacteroidales bacterium]